ncbi:hypothetical protein [Streptomyces sp. NBC_00162]|uniref:hypothetical protein n=1 Tax=Streptomyces sp. NBC_00162 TaxID=2903629 RepID=UPI00214C5A4C|nr:hypothetical protein [Streptomyces sp. NBC_00162]UUU37933.1 hypothetical protein JIW86_03055 [Streptomyces sp. NBC_00162]
MRDLLATLFEIHLGVDDPWLALWPDYQDAIGILDYARRFHCALPPATCGQRHRGDQAGIRLTIVRHLRAVLDREELAAIEDARADGMQWAAISRLLGMQHPGSAMNRRERLKAGTERPDGRRTREARKRISDNNY